MQRASPRPSGIRQAAPRSLRTPGRPFTRRIRDLVTLLDDLDATGVAFRTATEPSTPSTAAGQMSVPLLGVFAEFERKMIIDRVVNDMERKAARGKWTLGTAQFGYAVDLTEQLQIPTLVGPLARSPGRAGGPSIAMMTDESHEARR